MRCLSFSLFIVLLLHLVTSLTEANNPLIPHGKVHRPHPDGNKHAFAQQTANKATDDAQNKPMWNRDKPLAGALPFPPPGRAH
eukprot:scaffold266_cov391-Prasinococcus_capsulatus_cf.AAC.22